MSAADQVDWVEVEREYRANLKSVRQIARDHSIHVSYVQNRAKSENWEREPQPDQVRRGRKAGNIKGNAPKRDAKQVDETDPHRFDHIDVDQLLKRGADLALRMFGELEIIALKPDEIHNVIIDETRFDQDGTRRRELIEALKVERRTATLKNLVAATKIIADVKREGQEAAKKDRVGRLADKRGDAPQGDAGATQPGRTGLKGQRAEAAEQLVAQGGKFAVPIAPRLATSHGEPVDQ